MTGHYKIALLGALWHNVMECCY